MLWGMWEKVKTVGELEKSWGSSRNPWGSHFVGAVTEGCYTSASCNRSEIHTLLFCSNLGSLDRGKLVLFITTFILPISQPIWFSPERMPDFKMGFIMVLRYNSLFVTSLMFLCFLIFSIVLPKTELFINLKKSFSKSFLALVLN